MVGQALFAVILEIPDEVAIPIEFLKPTARGGALETRLAIDDLGGPEEMAVVEQDKRRPRWCVRSSRYERRDLRCHKGTSACDQD